MFTVTRRSTAIAAVCAALVVAATPVNATPASTARHPAGFVGGATTLASGQSFETLGHPYDVATNAAGTAYIGWISSTSTDTDRKVHLCTLPLAATSCEGGIQTIASLGISSASGLQVMVDGSDTVHLVWFHDTAQSINGPNNAAIAQATAVHGQNLTAATDITNAPSFGSLLDAKLGPGGIWTVAYAGVSTQQVQVWHSATGVETVPTPFSVGYAQLAFTGSTAVLAVEKYGAISTPPSTAARSGTGTWGGFHAVPGTWATGSNAALASTRYGLRIVTGVNNASYRPVVSAWNGSAFGTPVLTPDTNGCGVKTHDGWTDPSGRLLDVSWECSQVTVTNYPDAMHPAIFRFNGGGTPGHAPQIGSGTRGIGTVVWSLSQSTGETLRVARVRLPDSTLAVAKAARAGRVTVTGPRTCLPPVDVAISWRHRPRRHWKFKSGSLRLDGVRVGSLLDGATLTPGQVHTLVGKARFARGGKRRTVKATLGFRTCAVQ
jgi:hypothetical protein